MQQPLNWLSCGLDALESTGSAWLDGEEHDSIYVKSTRRYVGKLDSGFIHECRYRVFFDGQIEVSNTIRPFGELPLLPRMGVMLTMPAVFEQVQWYGLGDMETYPDRRSCGRIGLWTSTVTALLDTTYEKPQECGSHEDVRLLGLFSAESGLAVIPWRGCAATALHYTPQALAASGHLCELKRDDATYVYLDAAQMGLGNRSCGPEPLPPYRLQPEERSFVFTLCPTDSEHWLEKKRVVYGAISEQPSFVFPVAMSQISQAVQSADGYIDPSDPDARRKAGFTE